VKLSRSGQFEHGLKLTQKWSRRELSYKLTMRSDLKEGRFKVTLHDIDYPSGPPKRGKRFASISVRNDVIEWFKDEMKKHGEEYQAKYGKAAVLQG
jgi:uncharacterized protein (DUF4415 family)